MADHHYGITLQQARDRLGLSKQRAAALAGISRATLRTAEAGEDIGLASLRKLAGVLGIEEIDIGGLRVRTRKAPEPRSVALEPLAEEIERHSDALRRTAGHLRSLSGARVGKSVRNDTPSEGGVSALATHLAELVYQFGRKVQRETDPKKLKRLERDVGGLLHKDTA